MHPLSVKRVTGHIVYKNSRRPVHFVSPEATVRRIANPTDLQAELRAAMYTALGFEEQEKGTIAHFVHTMAEAAEKHLMHHYTILRKNISDYEAR
jgi:hypothetical protein